LVILTRVFLGEKIPSGWILQMVLCVTGALLVNKPLAPPPGCTAASTLIPIAAAFFGALMNFASRNVKDVPPPVVTAFNDLVAVIFSFGYLVLQRSSDDIEATILPDGFDKSFGIVIGSAVIGWFGLMSNVKGYQSVSVAAVASIAGYVSVPFGYITQILVFNEMPDVFSIVGALLILGTNISVAISKYHAMKAAKESECSKPLIGVDAQGKEEAKMGA
jgi:drug/metabolite transporter (DMT)-like permease